MSEESTRHAPLTVSQYLAMEEKSDVRHEYVRGELYVMTGTTARHNRIVRNLIARLGAAERGGPCRAYFLDLKVRAAKDVFYYPDVLVTCAPHHGDTLVFDDPCFLAEVASRGTRRVDRGEKVVAYEAIPSLRMYVVVEQYRRQVTSYSRDKSGSWSRADFTGSGAMSVPCPETLLTLDQIYEGVELPPLQVGERLEEEEEEELSSG